MSESQLILKILNPRNSKLSLLKNKIKIKNHSRISIITFMDYLDVWRENEQVQHSETPYILGN